jgi:hypothetical protein
MTPLRTESKRNAEIEHTLSDERKATTRKSKSKSTTLVKARHTFPHLQNLPKLAKPSHTCKEGKTYQHLKK